MKVKKCILICTLFFVLCGCGARSKGNTEDGSEQKETEPAPIGTVFGEMEAVGQEDAVLCNLPENDEQGYDCMLPVCRDPKYGIVYYVNVGRDYKIYAVKDGKAQMAVPIMGKRLYCRDGKLIFLAGEEFESGDVRIEKGNILQYDPVSGKVEILIKEEFTTIAVYQDMIICLKYGEKKKIDGDAMFVQQRDDYFYFFDSGELIRAEGHIIHPQRCGEEFLHSISVEGLVINGFQTYRVVAMELRTWDQVVKKRIDRTFSPYYYIKDRTICYYESHDGVARFISYHVDSEEEEVLEYFAPDGSEVEARSPYVVLDGRIYYSNCTIVSLDTGEWIKCFSDRPGGQLQWWIQEIYTDGADIYVLAAKGTGALTLLKVQVIPFSERVYDSWIHDPYDYQYAFSFSDPAVMR